MHLKLPSPAALGRPWLAACLLGVTLTLAPPAAVHAAPQPSARPAAPAANAVVSLGRLLHLVRTEHMVELPTARLLEGARKGLRGYLAKKHTDLVLPAAWTAPVTRFIDFKRAFEALLAGHPEIDATAATQASMRGLLEVLDDPYSVYLDAEEYKNLVSQLNGGNFGGLGIYIELDLKNAKALTVVEPMDGTPAWKAGVKAHDVLVEIGGVSTKGLSLEEASKLLRGPVGSSITLTIRRPGVPDLLRISMQRAVIRVKTLTYQVIDGQVGVVRLKVFGENCFEEIEEAFRSFDKAGVRGYVLDLRNNGGGYITAALDVVSHLLPTGSRVVTVAERGQPELLYDSRPNLRPILPLVVLINKYSASASEITAGAVKDLRGGLLMGEKSFGKGSVQKIFPLPDGAAVKITTAHYRTPSGQDIHKKGISPDVLLPGKLEDPASASDPQMKAAVTWVKQHITQPSKGPARDAAPPGVIVVASTAEEMADLDRLRANPPGWEVAQQRLVVEGEHCIDEVTLHAASGEVKVVRYLVPFIERP